MAREEIQSFVALCMAAAGAYALAMWIGRWF